ncbi:uncharacterized protein LOC128223680 isoform X3 [Mya arenaria]|uniref:uncharacterized protein LOC128223680 isoform X3 n=1 Tax=Mya arenaria TaxID=6604 RepID=UPI0022E8C882|nr:uncharacterized protein LOC128223680 isoform X3 [Mya arenaria]
MKLWCLLLYLIAEANGEDDKHPSRISTGTIVGIKLSLVAFCVICILTCVLRRRKQRKKKTYQRVSSRRTSKEWTELPSTAKLVDIEETDKNLQPKTSLDCGGCSQGLLNIVNRFNIKDDKYAKERCSQKPTEKGSHDIPPNIKGYEKYSNITKGKVVWICNFKPATTLKNAAVDTFLKSKEEAFTNKHLMMGEEDGKTCKSVIQDELKADDDTDCFVCIITSYGNSTSICYGEQSQQKDELFGTLAGLDNRSVTKKLIDRPKILIFDLYDQVENQKSKNSDYPFEIHKDWLIVFVRNESDGNFIKKLRSAITKLYEQLDFVSILEQVKGDNLAMNIIHRMPKKLFLSDGLESMNTTDMLYFDIKGVVNCCFFGTSSFDGTSALEGVNIDRESVKSLCNEFQYSSDLLHSAKETKKQFKYHLTRNGYCCHVFVFSSHGSSFGVLTKSGETVGFKDILDIVRLTEGEVPVVLVFDCCRVNMETNVNVTKEQLKMKNVIIVYAAVDGSPSISDSQYGSVFTTTMCQVIKEDRLKSDLLTMMERAIMKIGELKHSKQTCAEIESYLSKKLFLFETSDVTPSEEEPTQIEA